METLSDLNTFAKILTDKGYDGYFHTQGGYPGKLKESISRYLESCREGTDDLPGGQLYPHPDLWIRCYLQWKGEDKPTIQCHMRVRYLDGKFDLHAMEIIKENRYGLLKKLELTNLSSATAPTAAEAIAMFGDTHQQKGIPRNRRLRF